MSGKKKSSLAQGNIAWNDVVKRLKDIAKGKFSGTLLEREFTSWLSSDIGHKSVLCGFSLCLSKGTLSRDDILENIDEMRGYHVERQLPIRFFRNMDDVSLIITWLELGMNTGQYPSNIPMCFKMVMLESYLSSVDRDVLFHRYRRDTKQETERDKVAEGIAEGMLALFSESDLEAYDLAYNQEMDEFLLEEGNLSDQYDELVEWFYKAPPEEIQAWRNLFQKRWKPKVLKPESKTERSKTRKSKTRSSKRNA